MFDNLKELVELIDNNCEFYKTRDQNIVRILQSLHKTVNESLDKVERIAKIAPRFDYNEETPANGLRSFVVTYDAALKRSRDECLKLKNSRMKLFFSSSKFAM